MKRLILSIALLFAVTANAADVITARLTITNAANITGTNAETITLNADVRTWTNAVVNPATEILKSTNNARAISLLLSHVISNPFADTTPLTDGSTYVAWRGTNDMAMALTLSTNNWGYVTYTTNTVGTTHSPVVYPYTAVPAAAQTNMANGVAALLNSAVHTTGLSASKLLSGTIPLARIVDLTTNQIASAFYNWIDAKTDTDDQTAAEVAVTPAGNIAANDVQEALEELDTEKQIALGFTPVNKAGDTMTGTLTVTGLTNSALTASRVLVSGADKTVTSSSVTTTTLGYLDATSSVQTQLDAKVPWSAVDDTAYDATSWDANTNAATKNAIRDKIEAILLGGGLGTGDIDTSSELRGIVTDESGTGALLFAGGDIAAGTATTASADDNDTSIATTAFVQQEIKNDAGQFFEVALSDESTAITTGTAKLTWRAPFAFTVTAVRASLSTASSSGNPAVDINEGGVSIFSTTLTIDANEKTSTTAATAAVISDSSIADDAEITFDCDTAGTGAKGLKVKIYYTR